MYADIEEARSRRTRPAVDSSDLEIEKSSMRAACGDSADYKMRERELAEQLRKRAQASRIANGDSACSRKRSSVSSTPTSRDSSPRRSRSRSRSRDSIRSRKSHQSRRSSHRAAEETTESRGSRRRDMDGDESPRIARRDRETLGEDDKELVHEKRRRRSERDGNDGRDYDRMRTERHGSTSSSRANRDRYNPYYDERDHFERSGDRGYRRRGSRRDDERRRAPRRHGVYGSPAPSARSRRTPSPETDDYEERSVFCSQLSARLGQRDLGEFFEEHLGEGSVRDVRIVMDRFTQRSKGVGYVEFAARELVPKAINLTGKILFGIPILVQPTDAAGDAVSQNGTQPLRTPFIPHPALPTGPIDPAVLANLPLPMQYHSAGMPIHLNVTPPIRQPRPGPGMPNTEARLYVGSLHFSLTDENVKAVFEPFGEIEYVDLHRESGTGKSKGFCFIQFKHAEDAKKALEQMNGFEIAGRAIRVGNVNAKGSGTGAPGGNAMGNGYNSQGDGNLPQLTSAFDDGGGAGLNPERRAALMEKLSRNEPAVAPTESIEQQRPSSIPQSVSKSLLLENMFDPKNETETDWDKDLAEDVKDECQAKYGPVTLIHVEQDSAGEIYITFADTESSKKALEGLNGRFFGGSQISAQYIPDAFVKAKLE